MSSYTVADVDRVMNDDFEIPSPYDWSSHVYTSDDGSLFDLINNEEVNDVPTELGVISLEKNFGGEGQGDDYWVVVKITSEDGTVRYFRQDGWYQSYSGGELDGDTYEVKPTPKTVVFYE